MVDPSTIQMQAVSSSDIQSIGYDPNSQTLQIQFLSGAIYQYDDVPQEEVSNLMASDSKGSYAHQNIYYAYESEQIQ